MNIYTTRKMVLKFALVALLIVCFAIPATALADDWPQFHKDPQHTGYSTDTAPHTNNLLWQSADIGAVDASSTVVAEGRVYVNCSDYIRCLDEATGAAIWSQPIVGGNAWGSWAGPAYDAGKVFISGDKVYAFNATDGTPLWAYDLPNDACNGGPMAINGKVYASDWDGHHYYCLDASSTDPNGTLRWSFDCQNGYAQGVPAYYNDGGDGRVYFTGWSYPGGHLWCVNATTGALIWEGSIALDMCGSAMIADSKVWVTTYNFSDWGEIMAFDLNDIGSDGVGDLVWGPVTIERTDSTPAYHAGKIYVSGGSYGYSNEGERTYCIDVATETIDWQTPVGAEPGALDVGNFACSVAVANGLVFTGKPVHGGAHAFDYQAIYALDAATGAEVWHYDHGGASPSIANGKVFTVGEGKVWAFEDPAYPAWDVNQDGITNYLDMILIGNHYGENGSPGWIPEDVNNDGTVNYLDMILIGNHYGE
jgi:outer membrane protein assembly factor BamB